MNDEYIKILETQNEELKDKLAEAELFIKKNLRKKGTYPVFKIYRLKIKRGHWALNHEYLTNCDKSENIRSILKHVMNWLKDEDDLVGFVYWRQPLNYRWALAGMGRYLDRSLLTVPNIKIDEKTGFINYCY